MSAHTSKLLAEDGGVGCNVAKGVYVYGHPNRPLGNQFPPACIVEETLGDRRYGTHLLSGIWLLLPQFVDKASIDPESLLSIFPEKRPGRESMTSLVTTAQLMTSKMMGFTMGMAGHGLEWPDVPRDETCFASALHFDFHETAPDPTVPRSQYTNNLDPEIGPQNDNSGEKAMDPRWLPVWTRACTSLKQKLESLNAKGCSTSVLGYLFSRIGYDCGRIMRGLHKNRVSWGTYQDEMCRRDFGEWHCNAHSNNVVLLKENPGGCTKENYVGFLDLDMAFDEATFVDTWGDGGAMPTDAYTNLLEREDLNFMEVLAGGDTTTGVPTIATGEIAAHGHILDTTRVALFDTLILGYLAGRTAELRYPVAPFDPELHAAGYEICRLATIVMADYIA
jgi:hypothetical protein